ncbi:MAG: damage-inducible mutagenesis protein [Alphaproteobacteria bacterium]|nr:damage-inducible mutagenesis protein [Alphaproteobacteria bacterium]
MKEAPTPMRPPAPPGGARREAIARLKTEIARIEAAGTTAGSGTPAPGPVPFGIAAIDGHLPGGGLATGAVHEIVAGDDGMGATGFALALIARLTRATARSAWLWCGQGLPPYGPGLAGFGLDPAHLIVARCACDRDVLWAMEEGLGAPALAAILGDVAEIDTRAGRRLALAARLGGVTALLLRGGPDGQKGAAMPAVAATRWRVRGLPLAPGGGGEDGFGWRVDFLRGGGALPRSWQVLWRPGQPEAAAKTCEDGPKDDGWENGNTGGPGLAPPGALSLAAPLSGGAAPEGDTRPQRAAG